MSIQMHCNSFQNIALLAETPKFTNMNIIFDLTGVLFAHYATTTLQSPKTMGAYALQLINPGKIFRLLSDCIKQEHKLFIVSNLDTSWYHFLQADPQIAHFFTYFEDIVLADSIGIKKPDPRIFNHLIQKNSLNPRRCIFIDDTPINLIGAEQAGIKKGILCQNFDLTLIRKSLQNHGAL